MQFRVAITYACHGLTIAATDEADRRLGARRPQWRSAVRQRGGRLEVVVDVDAPDREQARSLAVSETRQTLNGVAGVSQVVALRAELTPGDAEPVAA
jgi:hypothetical protein